MIVYPAIDLRAGRTVNLVQGDFDRETVYDADPVAQALAFAAQGAQWIHVVDLDGARETGDSQETIRAICNGVEIPVQLGGGVRDLSLFHTGAARLVLGSLLLRDRAAARGLIESAPDRFALGLDHRAGRLRVAAWQEESAHDLDSVLGWPETALAAAVVVTDISADGMLDGPGFERLSGIKARCPVPLIASGGVGSLDDVVALRELGADGVVIGRALYEGRFTLEEAICAASG